jgi:hypothetical protein
MSYIKKVQKMEQLHKLILNEFRGSAKDYAEKLRISRGSLFNYLEDLKQAGAVISYCRNSNCFTYVNQFELELRVYSQAVNSIELNSSGGKE